MGSKPPRILLWNNKHLELGLEIETMQFRQNVLLTVLVSPLKKEKYFYAMASITSQTDPSPLDTIYKEKEIQLFPLMCNKSHYFTLGKKMDAFLILLLARNQQECSKIQSVRTR